MKSNYKRLGDYIELASERNSDLQDLTLIGLSIEKKFITSIANTIGTDMTTYRILKKNQFAYSPVTSRNGDKITIALFQESQKALISQAYSIFEVTKPDELLPEYLMMWFRRPEFDRYTRFKSHGSAREVFTWEDMCEVELPIPYITQQQQFVKEYNTITDRIALNNQLIQKLEATAQAIYKQWFVDFEFPDENGLPYKSNGGEMVESEVGEMPKGWGVGTIEDLATQFTGFAFAGEEYDFEEGITVLRGENVTEKKLRWDTIKKWKKPIDQRMQKCFLQENDIVIGMDGSKVGKNWSLVSKYDLPLLLAQRVACLRAKAKEAQFFIYHSMAVLGFEKFVSQVQTGTSIPHISSQQIFNFPLSIPSNLYVVKYDSLVEKLMTNQIIFQKQNVELEKISNLLLSKLATLPT